MYEVFWRGRTTPHAWLGNFGLRLVGVLSSLKSELRQGSRSGLKLLQGAFQLSDSPLQASILGGKVFVKTVDVREFRLQVFYLCHDSSILVPLLKHRLEDRGSRGGRYRLPLQTSLSRSVSK